MPRTLDPGLLRTGTAVVWTATAWLLGTCALLWSRELPGPGTVALACCASVLLAALQKDYAPGRHILCHCGSDNGKRAAMILTYQPVGAA